VADLTVTPFHKRVILSSNLHTPSIPTGGLNSHSHSSMAGNSYKILGKCSHVESLLELASSNQSNLANLAKDSYIYKIAHLNVKCKKMELAAKEWALVLKQQMQEKELVYKEHIIKYELKLAQLKVQNPATASAHPVSFG
jgi:hypothetical protein